MAIRVLNPTASDLPTVAIDYAARLKTLEGRVVALLDNGKINGDDYFAIDASVNIGRSGYVNGDFNVSGAINGDDYVIIDDSYTQNMQQPVSSYSSHLRLSAIALTAGIAVLIGAYVFLAARGDVFAGTAPLEFKPDGQT